MNKDELLSIIENQLKDNPKATSIEISQMYNIPVNIAELFIKIISTKQKDEESMPKSAENKTDGQPQEVRRNLRQEDTEEGLKNSPVEPLTTVQAEGKNINKKTNLNSRNNNLKTQVLAYVANVDSVSVINILAGKEITKIPLGLIPFDIAISPDKRYVYVTFPNDATLGVISVPNNREIAQINLNEPPFTSGLPLGAAVSPDGRFIYIANYDTSNISIVEVTKLGWKVRGEIPLTKRPERIAITPDGRLAYVTLRDDSEIAVIDLLANLPIKIMAAGTTPIDIAINKDYLGIAANPGSDAVTVFNAKLAESSPISIPVGNRPPGVALSPKENIAYITNRSGNSLSVINMFVQQVIDTIAVGTEPIGVAVTEDGRFTVVANSLDNTVSIIDTATRKVIYTVDVGIEPFFVKTVTLKKSPLTINKI